MTNEHNHRAALIEEARQAYETAACEYRENLHPERDPEEIPEHLAQLYSNWQSLLTDPITDTITDTTD